MMKKPILLTILLLTIFVNGFGQTANNCGNYTSTGSSSSPYLPGSNSACNALVPGTVNTDGAWDGGGCSGTIVTTVVGPPVTCLTVAYTAVNTDDYATLSTNTGGTLTITGVNVGVSGNVIGPYNCASGYGDCMVTICSTIPFTQLTLLNTGCSSGWVINCATATTCSIDNFTANVGPCIAGLYSTTGTVQFTAPPSSGQLIVEDCNGNQQVFNAPFTSPVNYTITGQNPNGLPCDVTAYFTANPACTQTINYTAPTCVCNIDNFNVSIGLCNQLTDTYCMTGDIQFSNPPAGGQLIVEVNNGTTIYDTVIFTPFVSGQTFSICGIPSNGSASSITVYFSSNPACSSTINYTAPTSCACNAEVGTFTASMTGSSTNNYVLCYGDGIDINSNGDWTGPGEMFNPPGPPYNPGVTWMIYSCPPTVGVTPQAGVNISSDPCFLGVATDFNINDVNNGASWFDAFPPGTFTGNTVYFVPLTFYDQSGLTYSYVNGSIPCYEMGPYYNVQYLPQFTSNSTQNCLTGNATVTLNGGLPAIDGSLFTASNLSPGSAAFVNTTCTNGGTIQLSGLQAGDMWSFDVTDANGCPYTVSGGPFPPLEDPTFTYPQNSWCQSEAPMLPNFIATPGGTFTVAPAGLTINPATGQITPGSSTPGTYDITYTTPGTCSDNSTITVNIAATPSVNPVTSQTVCNGANFTDVIFSGSTGTTFNWTNSNTNIGLPASGTGNIPAFAGNATGTQQVGTITVTPTAGSCVGPIETFTYTVNPIPSVNAGPDQNICNGTSVTLTAANPNGATINWNNGVVDGVAFTPALGSLTYVVTANLAGCISTDQTIITVNPVPIVGAGPDQTICAGTQVTLNGTGALNYVWDNGVTNGVAFTPATSNTYTVTGTDANNCSGTDQVVITVNPLDDPTFSYTPGLTYCQSAAVTPTINITGMTGGIFSYSVVSGGPNLSFNTTTGDVNVATSDPGVYDITYNTAPATGSLCPQTFTLQMVITAAPVADFTFGTYCANNADPLPTYINGGSGGTFSATPAGLVINPGSGLVDLSASVPGTYTVTNDINVAGCATATYTDDITINALPAANITGTTSICSGDPLPDVTVNITAGVPNWSLTYNYNSSPVTVNTAVSPFVISGAAAGTYDLVSITDGNGCTSAINGQAVITQFASPAIDPLVNQSICHGDDLTIQTFSASPSGGTFTWSASADVGFGSGGTGQIGSFTGNNNGLTPLQTTVQVDYVSADGCPAAPVTFVVTVNPLPQVSFTGGPLSGCAPLTVTFDNLTQPAGNYCLWNFGDGTQVNNCGQVFNTYDPGTFDVTLTVTTPQGCTAADTYNSYVTVVPAPEAIFSFSPQVIDVTDPVVDFFNASQNASYYTWDFDDGSPLGNFEEGAHLFPDTAGTYLVEMIAYDANAWCPDTAHALIIVDDIIIFYVPNVFTPDGDMFNETFQPVFFSGFDKYDYHLTIFNRWGEILFESYNAETGWKGTYGDGGLVQDGVYIWQIEFKEAMSDRHHTHRGHVTVLK